MKRLKWFLIVPLFLFTGCLLQPTEPANLLRPEDIPDFQSNLIFQITDLYGIQNQSYILSEFLVNLGEETPPASASENSTKAEPEMCTINKQLTVLRGGREKWETVSAGKVSIGISGTPNRAVLEEGENHVYSHVLTNVPPTGSYDVYVEGSKYIPKFNVPALMIADRFKNIHLNEEILKPTRIPEIKKDDFVLSWSVPDAATDYAGFTFVQFKLLSEVNGILTTLDCMTVEPMSADGQRPPTWKIPYAYTKLVPASPNAQILLFRTMGRQMMSRKMRLIFQGRRIYTQKINLVD